MIRNGWYQCPACRRNVQRVTQTSILVDTPVYCRHCKFASYPTIRMGREVEERTETEQGSLRGAGA